MTGLRSSRTGNQRMARVWADAFGGIQERAKSTHRNVRANANAIVPNPERGDAYYTGGVYEPARTSSGLTLADMIASARHERRQAARRGSCVVVSYKIRAAKAQPPSNHRIPTAHRTGSQDVTARWDGTAIHSTRASGRAAIHVQRLHGHHFALRH
jgi:hypothetical protein